MPAIRGTPDSPLNEHALQEERDRRAGDEDARLHSAMVRAFVPAGAVLTIPDRHQVVVSQRFDIDTDAELVFAGEDSELVILDHHDPDPSSVVDRQRIFGFNSTAITASTYLALSGVTMQAGLGHLMEAPGSVVGISFSGDVTVATSPGSLILHVKRGGLTVFKASKTLSATGIFTCYLTQAPGLSPFVAGEVLSLYVEWGTFVGTVQKIFASATLEF